MSADWDQDAAVEALMQFPPSSLRLEMLEEVGADPTSGPVYGLTVQARALLDQLKPAFFPVMSDSMRDFVEGMSVSVDVSTCDADAGHRYFGTVTEVMDDRNDKHGVTLLVQDAKPNFAAAPAEAQAVPSSEALPEGFVMMAVYGLEDLVRALDRAESKGYLPDAMRDAYTAFDYRAQPPQPPQAVPVAQAASEPRLPKYTKQMGEAAERYLYRTLRGAHALPAEFRWEECFRLMLSRRECEGCGGHGLVGNILDTQQCPFCEGSGITPAALSAPGAPPAQAVEPIQSRALKLLQETVGLCAIGDIDEDTDDGMGWGGLVRDAKALIAEAGEKTNV